MIKGSDPGSGGKSTDRGDVVKVNRLQGCSRPLQGKLTQGKKPSGICTKGPSTGKDKEMVKRVWCSFEVLSCMDNPSQRALEIKRGVVWSARRPGEK
jgi:hypothetical protein